MEDIICPHCNESFSLDEQCVLEDHQSRGLGGLVVTTVDKVSREEAYAQNSQRTYQPPQAAVTNGLPDLNAKDDVDKHTSFPDTDETIEVALCADLREMGFAAEDPTKQTKTN